MTTSKAITRAFPLLILASSLGYAQVAAAADPWALCASRPAVAPFGVEPGIAEDELPVRISAEEITSLRGERATIEGGVEVIQGSRRIQADHITLEHKTDLIRAEGLVRYQEPDFSAGAERASYKLNQRTGTLNLANYELPARHARGDAAEVNLDADGVLRLADATYTTCDPGSPDWELRADEVTLNRKEGRGVARDVTIEFKDTPILYWPYFDFPIDDRRKSGFLLPTIGNSGRTGFDLSIPYYWNVAPNYDATFTPRLMTDRGFQLQSEFRYLLPGHGGRFYAELLPDDSEFDDHREFLSLRHNSRWSNGWRATANLDYASDDSYFEDLGTSIDLTSRSYLERRVDVTYQQPWWSLRGRLQEFQTIDSSIAKVDRPYRLLPELRLETRRYQDDRYGWETGLVGEYTYFDHDEATKATGGRIDLAPVINLSLETPGYFVRPALKYRLTHYDLDRGALGGGSSITRGLPVLSVDGGLVLERPLSFRGRKVFQTLEPRLFYLYVPEDNQDDIPVFDSSYRDFDYGQLFRDNRFSGRDRVGDANQLSLALTTRMIDTGTGKERLRAGIGSIWYFRDREVTLEPGDPVEDREFSDLAGELVYRLHNDWYARTDFQWDPEDLTFDRATFQFHYQPEEKKIFNLGYLRRQDQDEPIEQTDLSFLWPVHRHWSVMGRWNYSLEDNKTLETFAGFEYESCCWAVRLLGSRFVRDSSEDLDTAVYLQLELKGLSRVGHSVTGMMERDILGYHDE